MWCGRRAATRRCRTLEVEGRVLGVCGKSRTTTRSSLEVRCDLEYKVGVKRVTAVPVEKQDEKVQKVMDGVFLHFGNC